jgi:hypothetical protein
MKRPRPAMVIAVIALILALTGTAYAALGKNSVGTRQLKSQAVTTAKLKNGAVNSAKVAKHSLTGDDVNVAALGTVPEAGHAAQIDNVNTVGNHSASCPSGTVLVRGTCFDSSSSGPVLGVEAAAEACAARGGWLPTTQELYAARGILNLGNGSGTHSQFTDSYYENTNGSEPRTTVVSATAETPVLNENPAKELVANYEYTCAYPLVR